MPERHDRVAARWGEELRRSVLLRRRHRRDVLSAVGLALLAAALLSTLVSPPRPRLLWNASASAPVGLYLVQRPHRLRVGDMVAVRLPERLRALAARRGYLPGNVPLVKRVAGVEGARICAIGETIWIDGRKAAHRRRADAAGRPLPAWSGCLALGPGELFLLMDRAGSFDGRYIGPSRETDVVGRALPLWTA